MKKAFTLAELIIVIIVLWILFGALWYLSWSYIYKLNIQNDKETLENAVSHIQSSSLSQPSFWKYKMLDFVGVKLEKSKSYITYVWSTWNNFSLSNIISAGIDNFYNSKLWTWFNIYSWWAFQGTTNEIYFMYKPYTIWSFAVEQDWTILTWNKSIKFHIIDNKLNYYKNCFRFDVASWRLYNIVCE